MSCRVIALALLCLIGPKAWATPPLDDNVRVVVNAWIERGVLSSAVIGIIDGSDTAVYGFGKVGADVPTAQTVYEIGSVTKTFTALLMAQSVSAGTATLDESVSNLLPDYSIPMFSGKPITLLDLATHTSCLPRMPSNFEPKQPENPYADYDTAKLKSFLKNYRLPCEPGTGNEYSNLGFGLLGQALAEQAKTTYTDLVETQITMPLGMTSTHVTLTPTMKALLAPGHDEDGMKVANWDEDALAGAGALRSNAQDLMRYLQAHMHPTNADTSPYALVQKAQRPTRFAQIGLAWGIGSMRGRSVVSHSGRTGGYASFVGFTADGRRGVVFLTNTSTSVEGIGFAILVPVDKSAP
jgi:CubicO group peptidase (beta-lactamase class C family)